MQNPPLRCWPSDSERPQLRSKEIYHWATSSTWLSLEGVMELGIGHYILLGQSGTGKSTFALSLARSWIGSSKDLKKIFILNTRNQEADVPSGCLPLAWEDFTEESNELGGSIVIIEDLISINSSNKLAIKQVINYMARRKGLYLLAIIHSLHGSALMPCLQFFNHLLVFGQGLNIGKSYKLLKEGGGLGSMLRNKGSDTLDKHAGKHGRFSPIHIDLGTQEMVLLDPEGRPRKVLLSEQGTETDPDKAVDVLAEFKEGMDMFLGSSEPEGKLFRFILRNLPKLVRSHGRPTDLTLMLIDRSGLPRRVSLLDFCATCSSPDALPTRDVRSLHKFLTSRMDLPDLLVKNIHLRVKKT